TRFSRDWSSDVCSSDLLLFQPRKPEGGANTYRPIAGYQIRGDSAVWNELDVHLSPYRTWVKASETLLNEWGQPKTVVDPSGWPRSAERRVGEEGQYRRR